MMEPETLPKDVGETLPKDVGETLPKDVGETLNASTETAPASSQTTAETMQPTKTLADEVMAEIGRLRDRMTRAEAMLHAKHPRDFLSEMIGKI